MAANGAKVYITGRRLEALEQAAKVHQTKESAPLIPLQADITSKESIEQMAAEFAKKESKLDILVNNAGIAGPTRTVEKAQESAEALQAELNKDTFDDWVNVYKTNVVGYYFTSVAFLPLLAKSTQTQHNWSASIINISSISGITRKSQHHLPYNTSKAATIQLNQLLAQEFSEPGVKVRVNSIAPGIFPSEMTSDGSGQDQKSHVDAKGYREDKGIPAGRPGKDDDMAQLALTLAVNQYMNGETVRIDGGYLLKMP